MGEVVSASRRTDLPAWYASWFLGRLRAGYARYRSPYSAAVHEVSLRPEDVVAFVFWTRDALPFRRALDHLDGEGFPYYFQYTLNGYPPDIEPNPSARRGLRGLRELSARTGPSRVVWRYDPILLAPGLEPLDHLRSFERLARSLSGCVDTVVVSFLDRYAKVEKRLSRQERPVREPEPGEPVRLLLDLQAVAAREKIRLTTCCEETVRPGEVPRGACIDAERIRLLAPGADWEGKAGPTRPGCACAKSRDIGAYDTCPFGCLYCYANGEPGSARRRRAGHRAEADRILL
jgi:hypothetical protein